MIFKMPATNKSIIILKLNRNTKNINFFFQSENVIILQSI